MELLYVKMGRISFLLLINSGNQNGKGCTVRVAYRLVALSNYYTDNYTDNFCDSERQGKHTENHLHIVTIHDNHTEKVFFFCSRTLKLH